MRSTTTERPSGEACDQEDARLEAAPVGPGAQTTRRWRPGKKSAVAVLAVAVGASLVLVLGGGDDSTFTTSGALGDATGIEDLTPTEPLPPRPALPDECVLADAAFVTELMQSVSITGAGGIDNPFVTDASGAFDSVVSARILGGGSTGALGLWGVTSDGAFVPLNDVAEGITVVADDVAVAEDVVAEARTTGAAELVSKCTKLSTGG